VYDKQTLITHLQKAGINPSGALLVHSSVKSVGADGDVILDAFIEFMRDGLLIFPTHTWMEVGYKTDEFPERRVYDPITSRSCVGVLTNLFLKRSGVVRSLHPTHSVAAIGRDASDYVFGEELTRTPCSRSGCYGRLYDLNAQILFLGCDLSKNTFIHSVEEWNDIPDRLNSEQQELYVKVGDKLLPCPQHRHVEGDVSVNYIKTENAFIEKGAGVYCRIGDAHSILCSAVRMGDLVSERLRVKPHLFSDGQPF
jgi:aminoglycoside 3-N-acetyltransferase